MELTRLRLGELLVDARIVTAEQLAEVLDLQRVDGRRLGTLLVERAIVSETQLTQILSQQLSIPWVSLYHVDFSKRLLSMVPRDVAVKYCLVPIYVRHVRGQGDTLYVAMDDPTNVYALRICASWSGLPTRAMIASPADIRNAVEVYYGPGNGDETPPSAPRASVPPASAPPVSTLKVAPPEDLRTTARQGRAPLAAEPGASAAQEPAASRQAEAPASPPSTERGSPRLANAEPNAPTPEESEPANAEPVAEEATDAAAPRRMKLSPLMALTLLDGTTLTMPTRGQQKRGRPESLAKAYREPKPGEEQAPEDAAETPSAQDAASKSSTLVGREIVAALHAIASGADAVETLGSRARWDSIVAASLLVLVRNGMVTHEELAEELKKV